MNKDKFIAVILSYPIKTRFLFQVFESKTRKPVIYLKMNVINHSKSHCVYMPRNQDYQEKDHLQLMCRRKIARYQRWIEEAGLAPVSRRWK